MKRLFVFFLILMFLAGVSIAESTSDRAFTADEQAYDVYLDLSTAYSAGVEYLEETKYLWKEASSLSSIQEADPIWFNAIIAAGNEINARRMICYQRLAQLKYGYQDCKGLYSNFISYLGGTTNTLHIVGTGIKLSTEAGYILSPLVLEEYLNAAKNGIRSIMSTDPDYAFLGQLQNYYKDLNLLLKYINDFEDSYSGFADKVDTFAEKQVSYTVDFEFIFDPSDYDYVSEVRNAEKQAELQRIYNQAMAAEKREEYEEAIEFYWKCFDYSDASERIESCRANIHEADYQKAISLQDAGNYDGAISLFGNLGDYKDTRSRLAQCREAILPCEDIGSFNEGLAAIKKDGKYGYVDIHGNLVIAREFDSAGMFVCGLAPVCKNEKWGYIDKSGQIIVPCEYNRAYGFENGFAIVEKNGKYGFVDTTGRLAIPCEYEDAWNYNDGLARVKMNGKWGFVNTSGELAFPCEYETAWSFCESLAPVSTNSIIVKGFIDISGKYTEVKGCEIRGNFSEGFIIVRDKNWKYGFADTSGKVVIPCQYDYAGDFHDGLARVMKDNRWGLIDLSGNWLVTLPYEPKGEPMNGIVLVWNSGKYGFISTDGEPVLDFVFDECAVFSESNGYYRVQQDGKYGVVNPNGKLEIPCEYSVVRYYSGYYTMIKDGKFYIQKAEEVIPRTTVIPESANPVVEKSSNYTTLKPGSKGQAVLDARMKLYELGYFSKKPTQTEFTSNMTDYVKKFEKDHGLKQDGILSPEDQEVLFSL